MTNRRILGFTWMFLALMTGLVLHSFIQWIWVDLMGRATLVAGTPLMTVPTVAAALTTALIAYGTWVHPGIHKYATEVVVELRKVVWPGRDELRDSTIIVVGCVVVFAAVLGGFDFIWAKVTNLILYRSGA